MLPKIIYWEIYTLCMCYCLPPKKNLLVIFQLDIFLFLFITCQSKIYVRNSDKKILVRTNYIYKKKDMVDQTKVWLINPLFT